MPSYTQGSGEEAAARTILPKGRYPFRVEDATEKQSSGGNDMIEMRLVVGDEDSGTTKVWEYLVFVPKAAWKIDQFLLSVGRDLEEGSTVNIEAEDLLGLEGLVDITVGKNNRGDDRNEVAAFIANEPF